MTALTSPNGSIDKKGSQPLQGFLDLPVAASKKCFSGGIAVLSGGQVQPGTVALGLIPVGFFELRAITSIDGIDGICDNSSGSAGALTAHVVPGTRKLQNSTSTDAIAQANVGGDCYIVDDNTVALTNGGNTRSRAGKVIQVDTDGVWVEIGLAHAPPNLAALAIQTGTGVLVAGVFTSPNTVTITANSTIFGFRKTKGGGTNGVTYDAPSADRTPGAPGTGVFKIRAYDSTNAAVATDVSTIDWFVIG